MTHHEWWMENSCKPPWRRRGSVINTKEAWDKGGLEIKEKYEKSLKLLPFMVKSEFIDGDTTRSIIYECIKFIREYIEKGNEK